MAARTNTELIKKNKRLYIDLLQNTNLLCYPKYWHTFMRNDLATLLKLTPNFASNLNDIKEMLFVQANKSIEVRDPLLVEGKLLNPKVFFRDILTEFIVNDMINNKKDMHFVHILNVICKALFAAYKRHTGIQANLVYRGGNILKIFKTNFDAAIPSAAGDILRSEFKDYFKSSDLDFYILVSDNKNPNVRQNIHQINDDLQALAYYALHVARIVLICTNDLFGFCNYNKLYADRKFKQILREINTKKVDYYPNIEEVAYVRDCSYVGLGINRYSYLQDATVENGIPKDKQEFVFDDHASNTYDNMILHKKAGHYDINVQTDYVTSTTHFTKCPYLKENFFFNYDFNGIFQRILEDNAYLDYYISNNFLIKSVSGQVAFRLSRLMINFTLTYKTTNEKYGVVNVPSELYDVSIGEVEDKMFDVYNEASVVPYNYDVDGKRESVLIPNINTLIRDLTVILFEYSAFPWQDPKYKKRLYRLIILLFIRDFTQNNAGQVRNNLQKILVPDDRRDIDIAQLHISLDNLNLFVQNIRDREHALSSKLTGNIIPIDNTSSMLLANLEQLDTTKSPQENLADIDRLNKQSKFDEFKNIINDVVKKLYKVLDQIDNYIAQRGLISSDQLNIYRAA